MLVLDEADEMINAQGQGDAALTIRKLLPRAVQVLLFSATFPPGLDKYVEKFTSKPNRITVEREKLTVDGIKQLLVECATEEKKFSVLSDIYATMTIGQSIVFVTTRATAAELARRMTAAGHMVSVLHGDLNTAERDRVIDEFRAAKSRVLITTNVLSRGIDIRGVTLVVNFDIPTKREDGGQGPLVADPEAYLGFFE